ncbi:hypothetical protein EVJ58_g5130 [Rhodofomes roseus]|uniref:C2H2-type domain-containing protein n=1 Tax=Rhodofomes roseus TaxID=34475 RepID=A0A4Y9YGA1_9APHY|nr:hypothetical protein EVJ58_g5130 [Rhodofomes roseus]
MAALILHFESGTCPSRITREQFNRAIAQYDKHHIITNPARMITHGEGDEGRSVVTVATERAWNGSAHECCICRREFRSLQAIDQHLASPAHAQKQFFCPRDFAECGAEFKAASALCQHIEREQCGVRRFRRQIEAHIECLTSSMKRLGF